jgi:hypothetical protein
MELTATASPAGLLTSRASALPAPVEGVSPDIIPNCFRSHCTDFDSPVVAWRATWRQRQDRTRQDRQGRPPSSSSRFRDHSTPRPRSAHDPSTEKPAFGTLSPLGHLLLPSVRLQVHRPRPLPPQQPDAGAVGAIIRRHLHHQHPLFVALKLSPSSPPVHHTPFLNSDPADPSSPHNSPSTPIPISNTDLHSWSFAPNLPD